MRPIHLLSSAALLLFSVEVEAKQLYVDAARGNDAVTYANNSEATPWATIGRAAWGSANRGAPNAGEAARAGDVVNVAPGVYRTAGTNTRFNPAYNPVNSGVAGSPITFRGNVAEPLAHGPATASVILEFTGGSGPVIGAENRSYIIWEGFYIDEVRAAPQADTGPVTINNSSNIVVRSLELKGIFAPWYSNHNGIRLENARFSVVSNNRVHGFGIVRDGRNEKGQNQTAVMLYDSSDNIIENNEFYECGTGVFIKGQQQGEEQARNVIRRNLIYNMGLNAPGRGIELAGSRDGQVYQNIIIGGSPSSMGISIFQFDQSYDPPVVPYNDIIQNNTIVAHSYDGIGFRGPGAGNNIRFYNNIISTIAYGVNGSRGGVSSPGNDDFAHNLYHNATAAVAHFGSNLTLDGWKSTFGKDMASPAAISIDPLFVNAAARNYRLQASSPALTLGRDLLNISGRGVGATIPAGAYITGNEVIGLGGSAPPPTTTAPASPTNLRIIS